MKIPHRVPNFHGYRARDRAESRIEASRVASLIEQAPLSEPHDEAFFWGTHQGAEIDLILRRGDRLLGIECKRADAPRMTRSMRTARGDLGLSQVAVIYPGTRRDPMDDVVEAVPLQDLALPGAVFTSP